MICPTDIHNLKAINQAWDWGFVSRLGGSKFEKIQFINFAEDYYVFDRYLINLKKQFKIGLRNIHVCTFVHIHIQPVFSFLLVTFC